MVATHYRWDFIGLSTDDKPTSETSEKVVNGSTFYCSDTSKLYVYCDGTWYERKPLGSGGGGTTYTAGNGIEITNHKISVDTDTIQEKLTAGDNITILNNVISATASGGGGTKTLTTADYNWNINTQSPTDPNCVGLWLLNDGVYAYDSSVNVYYQNGGFKNGNGVAYVATSSGSANMVMIESNTIYYASVDKSTGLAVQSRKKLIKENDVKNNLITSSAGSVLDARQGKELKALIDALDQRVTALGG